MQSVPTTLIAGANSSLGKTGGGIPLLGQPGSNGKLMLTVDAQFRTAAQTSAAGLATFLLGIEEDHFARLKSAIQTAGGP